jgi:hypothetical protein
MVLLGVALLALKPLAWAGIHRRSAYSLKNDRKKNNQLGKFPVNSWSFLRIPSIAPTKER